MKSEDVEGLVMVIEMTRQQLWIFADLFWR